MTKVRLPSGEERTINASASDVAFVQKPIALNDEITGEINLQADGLLSEEGVQGNAASFDRLKTLVNELHALLCDTVIVVEAETSAKKAAAKKPKKAAKKASKKGGAK